MSPPLSRSPERSPPPQSAEGPEAIPLRLTAARGGIGVELSGPQPFGPLTLTELEWTLPGLSFPLDLSGGVRAFRHRRGELQHAGLELDPYELQRWLRGRARELFGGLQSSVAVWSVPHGLGLGFHGREGCVAFEVLWAPAGERARVVVSAPRAAGGLRGPAIAHALLAVDAVFGRFAERRGRCVDFGPLMDRVVRAFLPALGFRVPAAVGAWLSELMVSDERIRIEARPADPARELPREALRALELAELVTAADESSLRGDMDEARAGYASALERAPRHPELCQAIAAIDQHFEERSEAALGLLVESLPVTSFGLVGAELLARVGDEAGAELCVRQQTNHEPYAMLAALTWLRLGQLSQDADRRLRALDEALAACPSSKEARFERFLARLDTGDLNGASADAEHLEAAERGSDAKHFAILRAAREVQARGYHKPALRLFERALRYLPKDAASLLGLGRCLVSEGNSRRALVLLRRAAELSSDRDPIHSEIQLELGKQLAQACQDLPQAIARVRQVAGPGVVLIEARALEARWRAQLGDGAGAALAWGKLRDAIRSSPQLDEREARWLLEAAQFARQRGDLRTAERQLTLALEIAPRSPDVLSAYRGVAAELEAHAERELRGPLLDAPASLEAPVPSREEAATVEAGSAARSENVHELGARAEALTARLLAGVELSAADYDELCQSLAALERDAELHALLWARFEDAAEPERSELRPRLRATLQRLVRAAGERGANDEAALYAAQLERLNG